MNPTTQHPRATQNEAVIAAGLTNGAIWRAIDNAMPLLAPYERPALHALSKSDKEIFVRAIIAAHTTATPAPTVVTAPVGPNAAALAICNEVLPAIGQPTPRVTSYSNRAQVVEAALHRIRGALAAPAVAAPVGQTLPLMSAAFRTTVSSKADGYTMVFRFASLADLDRADDEWRARAATHTVILVSPSAEQVRNKALEEAARKCETYIHCDNAETQQAVEMMLKQRAAAIRALDLSASPSAAPLPTTDQVYAIIIDRGISWQNPKQYVEKVLAIVRELIEKGAATGEARDG